MPHHMPYLPNNITWCIIPQMVALAGSIRRLVAPSPKHAMLTCLGTGDGDHCHHTILATMAGHQGHHAGTAGHDATMAVWSWGYHGGVVLVLPWCWITPHLPKSAGAQQSLKSLCIIPGGGEGVEKNFPRTGVLLFIWEVPIKEGGGVRKKDSHEIFFGSPKPEISSTLPHLFGFGKCKDDVFQGNH